MNTTYQPVILHVASGDLWAGAEVQLFTLARSLQEDYGIRVMVILLNHGTLEARLSDAGIQVTVLDETRLGTPRIFYRLCLAMRRHHPDVVHTHRLKENILGSLAARISGNIPSLRTVHGSIEQQPSWRQPHRLMLYFADRMCGRHLQKIIVSVSPALAGALREIFPPDRVRTIENGIDLATMRRRERPAGHPDNGTLRIGFAGRLVRVKRVDIFLKAAHHLKTHYPDMKTEFFIYGDGPAREDLQALSHELQIDGITRFEGHRDDMTGILNALDMLLLTSDHEGLPMVLLEAMAAETPVIAHAVGGIPTLLDNGRCGVLVHEQTPAAFADEIRKLAAVPGQRELLARNALDRVTNKYSSRSNAGQYIAAYRELLDDHE